MERESGGGVALSKRLQMLADMVTPGLRLADVGCDHGFLSIYLVQSGICPEALAMDVREGPLAGAKRHVEEHGLGDYISIRLSDGLAACRVGEAEAIVCAGMGGRLMERILREGMDRARGARELILQPQSELCQFRAFLQKTGFAVTAEAAVCEEGKYYFAMKAVPEALAERTASGGFEAGPEERQLYDLFGEFLLKERHPVLFSYLRQRECHLAGLAASLGESGSAKARGRLDQVGEEISQIARALAFYREQDAPDAADMHKSKEGKGGYDYDYDSWREHAGRAGDHI